MQPIIELKSELEGIIKLEIIKEDGTLKEAKGLNIPFKNLITNAGLNYITGGYSAYNRDIPSAFKYCRVGTSSVTPTVFDTALGNQTGSVSPLGSLTNTVQYKTNPYYSDHKRVYTFAVGAVSGNLTEIGFFSDTTNAIMWSRALIKDSGGNPTTLTLLATEQLKVTYTVRKYMPASSTGSFTLNTNGTNSTINYTVTPANITANNSTYCSLYYEGSVIYLSESQTLGPVNDFPTGSVYAAGGTISPYVTNSFEMEASHTVATTRCNFTTGIGSMLFGSYTYTAYESPAYLLYQCSFSPKIMKTSSQTLNIRIKLSCGRSTQQ